MYELMGRAHAALVQERGQGTVEYVGLLVLLAAVMALMVTLGKDAKIADAIVGKLKGAITGIG